MINKLPSDYMNKWVATSELAKLYKEKWIDATPEERFELLITLLRDSENEHSSKK